MRLGATPIPGTLRALAAWLALAGSAALAQQGAPLQVPDTMAQRMAACTVCHGKEGRATNAGYFPRIAGKPAGYLYAQLQNFRDGRRHNQLMSPLLATLSDAYLREMAEYFAALELPYPPPQLESLAPELRTRGEALVRRGDAQRGLPSCTSCHGEAMTGREPHVPGLLGLPRDYLNAQLGAWRTGQRRAHAPDCMHTVAERLDMADITALSSWLAAQPVPQPAKAAPATADPLPLACGKAVAP